jgi:hypothetical protein
VVSFTPLPLYPIGNSPRYPLYRRLGGPQSWSGCYARMKIPLPLPGTEPRFLGRSAHSLVAILTELPQLSSCLISALLDLTVLGVLSVASLSYCHSVDRAVFRRCIPPGNLKYKRYLNSYLNQFKVTDVGVYFDESFSCHIAPSSITLRGHILFLTTGI